jgi:hypothetical protein
MMNLLDPSTADDPVIKVRSLNNPSWVRDARISRLKADGGAEEIRAAVAALKEARDALRKATDAP